MKTIPTQEVNLLGDEIDLRRYLQILLKHWRWILLMTAVATAVAAGLSFLVLPATYDATALVAITSPRYLMEFSPEFRAVEQERLQTEIYKTYPELAQSDELLERVSAALAEDLEGRTVRLQGKLTVEASKTVGIIRLKVQDQDPALAALIVNTWAELYVPMLNDLYGGEEQEQSFFEEQLAAAEQDLFAARDALAEFKADDPALLLSTELDAAAIALADYQQMRNTTEQLKQEIANWLEQLALQSNSQPVSQADEWTSLLMQIEAFGVLKGRETLPQFQIVLQPVTEGRSVAEQIAFLENLESLLQNRSAELDLLVAELESNILSVQHRLQIAENEDDWLTEQVKNAKALYESLSLKTEEARIASESQLGISRLASRASEPTSPIAPRKLVNTAIGAGLGLALGLALAVLLEFVGDSRLTPDGDDPVDER